MATIILKNVRLAFPDLFEAASFDEGAARYGANFLVEPDSENDRLIRATIGDAVKEALGVKAQVFLKQVEGQNGKFCYRDGDAKTYDGFEGNWYIAAHRNEDQGPPAVVDKDKTPLTQKSGKVYAGCYVNAKVDIWVQQGKYPGVRASLLAVQFAADGDAFAGAPANAEGFDDLSSDETGESEFY